MRRLLFFLVFITHPMHQAMAECPQNPSCQQMSSCDQFETFRIPMESIRQCIEQGFDPPLRWSPQGGRGAVNTGGIGSVDLGSLSSPYDPPGEGTNTDNGSTNPDNNSPIAGAPGGGFDLNFNIDLSNNQSNENNSGNNNSNTNSSNRNADCSGYRSPYLLGACSIRGEAVPISQAPSNPCGLAIPLDHERATLTRNATHAVMTKPGENRMSVYRVSGANHSFSNTTNIPTFYCELRIALDQETDEEYLYAHKIPIVTRQQYAQLGSGDSIVLLDMDYPFGVFERGLGEGVYLPMYRQGQTSRFSPPSPNPDYFRNEGARDVDDNCYSFDRLFTSNIPNGFGDIMFGKRRIPEACETRTLYMHSFLPEPESCIHMVLDINGAKDQVIIPPLTGMSSGRVSNGNGYTRSTIRGVDGNFTPNANGQTFYMGPQLYLNNSPIWLSTHKSVNEQAFLSGARFTLSENRFVRASPPGRIRLFADGRMQLTDGGVIEDGNGRVIRQMSANSLVQFTRGRPVEGSVSGNIKMDRSNVIATNAENIIQLPYDTRLDQLCE